MGQIHCRTMRPHILVVDDDERIRDLLGSYLRQNGFRVTQAENGAAARAQDGGARLRLHHSRCDDARRKRVRDRGSASQKIRRADPDADGEVRARTSRQRAGTWASTTTSPKPFEPRELLLRLQNILKRRSSPRRQRRARSASGLSRSICAATNSSAVTS